MFKDKLKNDLDKLSPDEQTKSAILSRIDNEKVKPLYPKIISAVAACLAIVLAVGVMANVDKIDENVKKHEKKVTSQTKTSNQTVYDKIYKAVNKKNRSYKSYFGESIKDEHSSDSYASDTIQEPGASKDYSKTNTVVEDVDEDDLFKTDGDYIYQVDESDLNIYKAEDKKTKKIKTLDLSKYTDYNIKGMYLFKNKLVVLTTYYDVLPYTSCKCKYCTKINKQSYTTVLIYDVKNPKEAKLKTKFIQSGYYNSSRMIDDTLYLSSTYTPDIYSKNKIKKKEKSRYLPIFYDGKNYHYQNSGCINLSDKLDKTSYSIIASYSIDYNLKIDDKSFFGYADLKFVSNNNAYFTEESYRYYNKEQFTNKTKITKFSIDNGAIKFVASKKIEGGILNSFSMDEKDGYLRLVTTQQKDKSYNHLFVLDKNLHKVGSVENLAKNERIYSARFLGDYAYFVTYRNTDPLFCADLSNPQEPKIVSELKIPGFSNYLHPFGKNKIFGLGETDGGNTKIAMYDISNKEKIKEIVTKKLGANYSDASYDHHAIMVDEKKNLIAFPVDTFNYNYDDYDDYDYEDLSYYEDVSYYYIFKFSNNKFKLKARIKLDDIYKFRGLYIDDYFYISDSGHLRIVSLKTFKQVKKV